MFSVVIPYYEKYQYLERCLDSVIQQTISDFEILLIDDGSKQPIDKIVNQSKYSKKLKVIRQENKGVSAARNLGIKESIYDYIAFLDADDLWHDQYLETIKWVVDENPDVKIVGSRYTSDLESLKGNDNGIDYIEFNNYFKIAVKNTYFSSSSCVVKKSFFEFNPGFNETLNRGEDIDVWIRAVASGGGAYYISNTLAFYSQEDENQLTKTKGTIENALVGRIVELYGELILQLNNKDFEAFLSKYVYLNLYPYYYRSDCYLKARESLKKIPIKYFLPHLVYILPKSFGKHVITSALLNKILRLYLKLVLRYFT